MIGFSKKKKFLLKYDKLLILIQDEDSVDDEYIIYVKLNNHKDYTNEEMKKQRIICCLPFTESETLLKFMCKKFDEKFIRGNISNSFRGKESFIVKNFIKYFMDYRDSRNNSNVKYFEDEKNGIPPLPSPPNTFIPRNPFPHGGGISKFPFDNRPIKETTPQSF